LAIKTSPIRDSARPRARKLPGEDLVSLQEDAITLIQSGSSGEQLGVLVVDDQPLFREGVVATLTRTNGFYVVGEACSGREALALMKEQHPDIVLLDLDLPDGRGIEFIRPLLKECPETRIVVLTDQDDSNTILQSLRAGAAGYLLKNVSLEEMIAAVRDVSGGRTYASPAIAMRVLRYLNASRAQPVGRGLTTRGQEILELLAEGMTNQEIATRLLLNEKTVKRHVTVILKKLGARNRVEAALVVWRRRACGNHLDCAKRKPL
jgi:two-component system, NarL family, nitrate/nitrite response regulator NarL